MNVLRKAAPTRHFTSLFAPASQRIALVNLHLLDLRLEDARINASELQIALIKLAWWRDVLADIEMPGRAGEPLLAALSNAGVPAWSPLLAALAEAHMDVAEAQGDGPARRGAALFQAAAAVLSVKRDDSAISKIGRNWGTGEPTYTERRVPKAYRPITALARIADKKAHSPTRQQLAIVAHILTGRF